MSEYRAKIRLFVTAPLGVNQSVQLDRGQANYLFNVMRLKQGARILVFNGRDGEWQAEVTAAQKRHGTLLCLDQTAVQKTPPDLWLLFAPIKKARTDFIVEKAVEMGVYSIFPVQTEYTNSDRLRQDRLQSHAVEAAEQCGACFVPKVAQLQKLEPLLAEWPHDRQIMFCDETLAGAKEVFQSQKGDKWAILIGPEGGFSPRETANLRNQPFVTPFSLGPRILRADTAAVAAMTLWQSELGDWG